jgi:hypothetical protein
VVVGLLALAPIASADDLLVLNGDTETLSGAENFGLVYIDGDLQLVGNTSITASSIYIGPDATLDTCYVPGKNGGDTCTAGRSLTLTSSGPLTVANQQGIDLTAASGTVRPGGNLSLSGSPVVVTGNVTTAGSGGGTSGTVTVNSGGALGIGSISAPGAAVSLHASGSIDVDGAIASNGSGSVAPPSPLQAPSAGPVTVASGSGDVRIDGAINASGANGPSPGPKYGGNGAPVTISGANLRTGAINTTGGSGYNAPAGSTSPIKLSATGSLSVLGQLNASGQNGTTTAATAGQPITVTAVGPLTVAGGINSSGGQSPFGGAGGGVVTLAGSTVTADAVNVSGGNSSGPYGGGAGGTIAVTAPGGASLVSLQSTGGNVNTGGTAPPGWGGSITVTSASGSIDVGTALTNGGSTNQGPGNAGGGITLSAGDNLAVGTFTSDGSNAGGQANPPQPGGNAGNVTLRASTGNLSILGNSSAAGGTGGSNSGSGLGGQGGNGGQIEVVAHTVGPVASLSSAGGAGGDYGTNQGPGGTGGAIWAWTNAPLFNDQQLVTSDGGNGNPTGTAGSQHQDSSPTGVTVDPTTGKLSFTSQSPDASGYTVLRSEAGATPVAVLSTTQTSDLHPSAPLCVPVTFTVVALDGPEQWTSDPSAAVAYTRQPSAKQQCSTAPLITAVGKPHSSLRRLRRAAWVATVRVTSSGIGTVQAVLGPGRHRHHHRGHASGTAMGAGSAITRPGHLRLHVTVPPADRQPGTYTIHVYTVSPDGKGHATSTLKLQITL